MKKRFHYISNILKSGRSFFTRSRFLTGSKVKCQPEKKSEISHGSRRSNRGYTLLLSVVVASIILAIGVGMITIVEKGLILSSAGRESQFAFYAADSGGECALYWDIRHTGFGDTVFATSSASTPPSSGVVCNNQDIASEWTISERTADSAKTTFSLTLSNGTCATVLVHKQASGAITTIESRGVNTCDTTFHRRVERGIRITY